MKTLVVAEHDNEAVGRLRSILCGRVRDWSDVEL